jgi:DNA-binding MarR family transcriptional regulator
MEADRHCTQWEQKKMYWVLTLWCIYTIVISMMTKTIQEAEVDVGMIDEITGDCLLTRTRRISRVITSIFDQELRPFGVSASQFSMLVLIAGMDGASRAELARANHQERSTSTRNLQLVLSEGWAKEVVPEKGRSRPIVISLAGRNLLAKAMPAWRAAQAKAKRLLSEEGAAALVNLAASLPPE